jgi:hypothetical protein
MQHQVIILILILLLLIIIIIICTRDGAVDERPSYGAEGVALQVKALEVRQIAQGRGHVPKAVVRGVQGL